MRRPAEALPSSRRRRSRLHGTPTFDPPESARRAARSCNETVARARRTFTRGARRRTRSEAARSRSPRRCLVGAGIAAYLTYVHYAHIAPICTSGGCEKVQRSKLRGARRRAGGGARPDRATCVLLATVARAWGDGGARRRVRRARRRRLQRLSALGAARADPRDLPAGASATTSRLRAASCSTRFLREPARLIDTSRAVGAKMTRRGVAALRGDVRHLGHAVPDDPRRRPGARRRRRSCSGARRSARCSWFPRAASRHELRPLLRVWWPLLAYTVIEIGVPWLLLARAETKLTSSLTGLLIAGVPLVGAVLVGLTGDARAAGDASLARPARRAASASPRSSGSTSAACHALAGRRDRRGCGLLRDRADHPLRGTLGRRAGARRRRGFAA